MAKLVVNFDTKSKVLSVKLNGAEVDNVSELNVFAFKDFDKKTKEDFQAGSIELITSDFDADNSTFTRTRIMANDDGSDNITKSAVDGEKPSLCEELRAAGLFK